MNLNDYAKEITKREGLKKQISIAQIKEVLKIINKSLNGELYKLVRKI